MLSFEEKNWQLSISRNLSFFHGFLDVMSDTDSQYFGGFGLQSRNKIHINFNGARGHYFYEDKSLAAYYKTLEKNILTTGWLEKLDKIYKQRGNDLLERSKLIEKNFSRFTFEKFIESYTKLCPGLFLTSAIGRHIASLLTQELHVYYPRKTKQEIEFLVADITYPYKPTPLMECQISLLSMGAGLQLKNLSSRDIEKNKSLIKKFKKHVAAFSVIPTNFNEEPWSEKEILNQLGEIMKQDCRAEKERIEKHHKVLVEKAKGLLKEINDFRAKRFAQALQTGTILNEYRKNIFSRASLAYRPLFKKISEKYELTDWRELLKLAPHEIIELYYQENRNILKLLKSRDITGVGYIKSKFFRLLNKFELKLFVDDIKLPSKMRHRPDKKRGQNVLKGIVANKGMVKARIKIILGKSDFHKFKDGDVIVAPMTSVDFVPLMTRASAFITDEGGITSHAAIVSRELDKPCLIGTQNATKIFKDGDLVEVDAERGVVRKI